jgi:hypothetical protein
MKRCKAPSELGVRAAGRDKQPCGRSQNQQQQEPHTHIDFRWKGLPRQLPHYITHGSCGFINASRQLLTPPISPGLLVSPALRVPRSEAGRIIFVVTTNQNSRYLRSHAGAWACRTTETSTMNLSRSLCISGSSDCEPGGLLTRGRKRGLRLPWWSHVSPPRKPESTYALPLKPDIVAPGWHVRDGPESDARAVASRSIAKARPDLYLPSPRPKTGGQRLQSRCAASQSFAAFTNVSKSLPLSSNARLAT